MDSHELAPTAFEPLGTPGPHFAELERRLAAYWRGSLFATMTGARRWRNFRDLDAGEKAGVKRMWKGGDSLMRIAAHFACYPGTVATAAEAGHWQRPNGTKQSIRSQILELLDGPDGYRLSNPGIAERVGSSAAYVASVRVERDPTRRRPRGRRVYAGPPPLTLSDREWAANIVMDAERVARTIVRYNPRLCGYVDELEAAAILAPVDRSMTESERLSTMNRACRLYADENLLGRTTSLDEPRGVCGYTLHDLGVGAVSAR